jgi:type I restriction enzyme M protein
VKITYNHPEGIKGAEAVASVIFLSRMYRCKIGNNTSRINIYHNYYNIDFTLDEIQPTYRFNVMFMRQFLMH